MAMTVQERALKRWLKRRLRSQGYVTYAKLLSEFEVRALPPDANEVAYIVPDKGEIWLNPNINDYQASVLVRHEILHEFLQHQKRMMEKLANEKGFDPTELTDQQINELKHDIYSTPLTNIAGDYEISNRGYTQDDKEQVRNLMINGQLLSGLVTEDDHPEWVNLSLEEMYDELRKTMKDEENNVDENTVLGMFDDETTFYGIDGRVYGV